LYSQAVANNRLVISKEKTMNVGCFALVDSFSVMDHQLERIAGLGFKHADVTETCLTQSAFLS
jgi:hypothetical protein